MANYKDINTVEQVEKIPEGAGVLITTPDGLRKVSGDQVGGIDAIVFTVVENTDTSSNNAAYVVVCNHAVEEVGELLRAGANCTYIISYAAYQSLTSAPSALATAATEPTFMRIPEMCSVEMSDGSYGIYFYSYMMDIGETITYAADGTITSNNFPVEQPK